MIAKLMPLRRSLPALLLAAILCAYIVYPVLTMLSEAFTLPVSQYRAEAMGWNADAQPFAAPLRRLFSESNAVASVIRTVEISRCSVLTACAWGTALALLWQRREFPGRKFFAALG